MSRSELDSDQVGVGDYCVNGQMGGWMMVDDGKR